MSSAGRVLVVLGGLPGTGKTTVARVLARRLRAVHVRIDSIEAALVEAGLTGEIGPLGYAAAYAVARDQLGLGWSVVADSVNPIESTRAAWLEVGAHAGAHVVEVELTCADRVEHRHRVADRVSDIASLALPAWADVVARECHPWTPDLSLDTSRLSPQEAAAVIAGAVRAAGAVAT